MAAGADYVRFTVPSLHDVRHIKTIRERLLAEGRHVPLIADVHFSADIALAVADHVDKVRINPGNFCEPGNSGSYEFTDAEYSEGIDRIRKTFGLLVDKCRERGTALRVGVNHGSLSWRIMSRYGDTPSGMAESAMEFLRICREKNFSKVVVSMKASNVRVMVQATRLVVKKMEEEGMNYPLHLGVTEAGEGEDGRIKSAAGIGALLYDGIGDTIRVSLTEDPEREIPVALKLTGHFSGLAGHDPLPGIENPPDPYVFSRRQTTVSGIIGGHRVPVVIGEKSSQADYNYADTHDASGNATGECRFIIPYEQWLKNRPVSGFPYLDVWQYAEGKGRSAVSNFVRITYPDLDSLHDDLVYADKSVILVYECLHRNVQSELRWLHYRLKQAGCSLPVVIRAKYRERDAESLQIRSAADLGGTFIDGFGDGLWLINDPPVTGEDVVRVAFGILQACRSRISRTEFISCPSCGRTNFNLMETLSQVKKATSHLKGMKIAVMGCIVNGPGEMADADYGYVGSGKGKITLYRSGKVVKRGIPEGEAVDELIALIREWGDWTDP